jgi:hypothetical protein
VGTRGPRVCWETDIMNTPPHINPPPLPRWVIVGGSGLVLFHFLALGMQVLAAPSGPWPMNSGPTPAWGPLFATEINLTMGRSYLRVLHMEHDYHFMSNVVDRPMVYFEIQLKDANGNALKTLKLPDDNANFWIRLARPFVPWLRREKTLKFPDDNANFWVRQRQQLLAQQLGDDQPVQPPRGEIVLPKGQSYPTVQLWFSAEGDPIQKLVRKSELELPRDRPLSRPSDWSQLLAQAYVRHLCREYGAASGELVRHSRNALLPDIMFVQGPIPREAFSEMVCNFGDYRP